MNCNRVSGERSELVGKQLFGAGQEEVVHAILTRTSLCSRGRKKEHAHLVLLHFLQAGFPMVRRGWTHVEVPSGWVQVLRGPRPPSVQWPAKGATNLKFQQERRSSAAPTGGKGSGKVAPRQKVRDAAPLPGRTPEMKRTAAVAKIARRG